MSSIFPASNKLLREVRRACIAATPKDTGNLAYNSLRVYNTTEGFGVVYKGNVAGYGAILNDFRLQRGYNRGKVNPHYLWFDSGVHNNVLNELVFQFNGKNKRKPYTQIDDKTGTFKESAEPRHRIANDGSVIQTNTSAELRQMETTRDWNSRYEEFKNHNEKGWAK